MEEQLYCAKDFINAVQITYAIIYVLNLKFSIANETVWNFIGQYFFQYEECENKYRKPETHSRTSKPKIKG